MNTGWGWWFYVSFLILTMWLRYPMPMFHLSLSSTASFSTLKGATIAEYLHMCVYNLTNLRRRVMLFVASLSCLITAATGSPLACASATSSAICPQSSWLATVLLTTVIALSTRSLLSSRRGKGKYQLLETEGVVQI